MVLKSLHAWTRPANSDNPIVRTKFDKVAVSADFTAYLIRADGKLLMKKYYKGARLGRPCLTQTLAAFPAENYVFLFETKRGKPVGIIPTGAKGVACAFMNETLLLLTPRSLLFYEKNEEGKYVRVRKVRIRGEGLDVDYSGQILIGTTEGMYVGKEFVEVGRVDWIRGGPLIAASVPGGVALYDGTAEVWRKEGLEVSGLAWTEEYLIVGDRSKRRVLAFTPEGKEEGEFKFTGVVRSVDAHSIMVVAQRRKVQGYLILKEEQVQPSL